MSDSEDEIQDWSKLDTQRLASALKRGEKDERPSGTERQKNQLAASRSVMYELLGAQTRIPQKGVISATWIDQRKEARVDRNAGTQLQKMGYSSSGVTYLSPEETVYLVERQSMLLHDENESHSVLSLAEVCQRCYSSVGTAKMLTYTYLRKLGYVVVPVAHVDTLAGRPVGEISVAPLPWASAPFLTQLVKRWLGSALAWRPFYTSFGLVLADTKAVSPAPAANMDCKHREQLDYYVWRPSSPYKRSDRPTPDFYVKVVDATKEDVPSGMRCRSLLSNVPLPAPESSRKSPITRARNGLRKVSLAVVDSGVLSFVELVDTRLDRDLYKLQ